MEPSWGHLGLSWTVLKRSVKMMLRTSQFFEDVPSEKAIFRRNVKYVKILHAHFWGMSHAKRLFLLKKMLRRPQFCEDVSSEIAIFRNLTGQEREASLCPRSLSDKVGLRTSRKLRNVAQTTNTNTIGSLCWSAALFCRVGLPCC